MSEEMQKGAFLEGFKTQVRADRVAFADNHMKDGLELFDHEEDIIAEIDWSLMFSYTQAGVVSCNISVHSVVLYEASTRNSVVLNDEKYKFVARGALDETLLPTSVFIDQPNKLVIIQFYNDL